MYKKELSHRLPLLLLALLLWAGCAHKPVATPNTRPKDSVPIHDPETTTLQSESMLTDMDVEDGFEDDFFEDEFEEDQVRVADPLSPLNKAMFHFNDKLYFWLLKPITRGYKAVTPEFFRTGVKNFFRNITTPIRIVNCLFQGKTDSAGVEFSRFFTNTIIGVLGFGSPADKYPELTSPSEEDLGQTLAVYGLSNGIYIVWPVFGPSTLRDSIGMAGDWFLNPVNYIEPVEMSYAVWGFDRINQTSFRIGEYEALKEASIDPYVAVRDIYLQYREKKIKE